MLEFNSNFSIDNGVCSSTVQDIKIEFNYMMLGEWFEVPFVSFDVYYVGSKIVFYGINERIVLNFFGVKEKNGSLNHNVLSPLNKLLYNIRYR